jgi:putative endonuclease
MGELINYKSFFDQYLIIPIKVIGMVAEIFPRLLPFPLSSNCMYNNPNGLEPMNDSQFCVYIMTDHQHSLLYTGRTGNLKRRVAQHRSGNGGVFTRRYNLIKLVYYEAVEDSPAAKLREKQIKRSSKKKRLSMIEAMNPEWLDLYEKL